MLQFKHWEEKAVRQWGYVLKMRLREGRERGEICSRETRGWRHTHWSYSASSPPPPSSFGSGREGTNFTEIPVTNERKMSTS